MTGVLGLIAFLVLCGVGLYLIPMEGTIKRVLVAVVLLVGFVWLLAVLGVHVGSLHIR